jgi:choline-glycine betaine transporter
MQEFIIGTMAAPTIYVFMWMIIFGGAGLRSVLYLMLLAIQSRKESPQFGEAIEPYHDSAPATTFMVDTDFKNSALYVTLIYLIFIIIFFF